MVIVSDAEQAAVKVVGLQRDWIGPKCRRHSQLPVVLGRPLRRKHRARISAAKLADIDPASAGEHRGRGIDREMRAAIGGDLERHLCRNLRQHRSAARARCNRPAPDIL